MTTYVTRTTWKRARSGAWSFAAAAAIGAVVLGAALACDQPVDAPPDPVAPGDARVGEASDDEVTSDEDLEGRVGFGGEEPPTAPEGSFDLAPPSSREEALTPYGWLYQGTLYYFSGTSGLASLSGSFLPLEATDVLLEAPVACAPFVRWGGMHRVPYGGYRTLYFLEQVQAFGYYQAHYRIGYGYGFGPSTYDAIFLSVYGYPYNAGYGYCPIHVYTRYGYGF